MARAIKHFKEKPCKKCLVLFTPTGAKQFWCSVCAPEEKLKNSRNRARVYMQEARKSAPKEVRSKHRKHTLKTQGWTPEMYETVYLEQKGKCAICFCSLINSNQESRPHKDPRQGVGCADHIHSTPPIPRGILCSRCNVVIAMAQDNQTVLFSAIQYLRRYDTAHG